MKDKILEEDLLYIANAWFISGTSPAVSGLPHMLPGRKARRGG